MKELIKKYEAELEKLENWQIEALNNRNLAKFHFLVGNINQLKNIIKDLESIKFNQVAFNQHSNKCDINKEEFLRELKESIDKVELKFNTWANKK